jgi:hypothetical protein
MKGSPGNRGAFCMYTMTRICYIALILVTGCSSGQRETMAHITQRRQQENGKLVISYRFYSGSKWIHDSMEVANTVIPHDSVTVLFSPENPEKNRLRIP